MKENKKNTAAALEKKRKEEAAFYRIVAILVITIVAELVGIIFYKRLGNRMLQVGADGTMNYLRFVFAAAVMLFGAFAVYQAKLGKNRELPVWGGIFALVMFISAELIYYGHGGGALTVCVAAPVTGALAFVYIIFRQEFFIDCVLCTFAIVTLAAVRGTVVGLTVYAAISLILCAAAATVSFVAVKNGGDIGSLKLFELKKGAPVTVFVVAAVSALTVLLSLILGASFAYGAICALGALLFIDAVYHTVNLM